MKFSDSLEGIKLLPQKEGQAKSMLICDVDGASSFEIGHWYSPDAVVFFIRAAQASERKAIIASIQGRCSKHENGKTK